MLPYGLKALKLYMGIVSEITMPRTIVRVRYEKGVLRLLDDVEATEGEEFMVVIAKRSFKGFSEKAGRYTYRVKHDVVEEFVKERK